MAFDEHKVLNTSMYLYQVSELYAAVIRKTSECGISSSYPEHLLNDSSDCLLKKVGYVHWISKQGLDINQ